MSIDTRKYRILISDDDTDARLVLRMMVERAGYQVFEATDGLKAIEMFEEVQPDVVLLDAMMPNLDGFSAAERILDIPGAEDVPIVMVTALNDDASIERAFKIGATDYITKPVILSVLRHRLNRLIRTKAAEDVLRQIIDDQRILHRIDRELGYTLNLDRVLNLAMDSAMRRTGATACVIGWIEPATMQLTRLASIGGNPLLENPIPKAKLKDDEDFSAVFVDEASIAETSIDDVYTRMIVPLINAGQTAGVIILDRVLTGYYDQSDLNFLTHLAGRTAVAIDKTRNYQQSQNHISSMDRLHEINNAISSNLDRREMQQVSARGLMTLLGGSSAFFAGYDSRKKVFVVKSTAVDEDQNDLMPDIDTEISMQDQADFLKGLHDGLQQYQASESTSVGIELLLKKTNLKSALIVPLTQDDKLIGVLITGESQYERYFSDNDIALARSLGIHTSTMLKQSDLFAEISELEQVKSEMIRMASHDLKNPLLQVGGYLDLLVKTLVNDLDEDQKDFVGRIENGLTKMNRLLEDILNLERVESHRTTELHPVNLRYVLIEVAGALESQAHLKQQFYRLHFSDTDAIVLGNEVQLNQCFTNFIGNAIKYTPEQGTITIKSNIEDGVFHFHVKDTGYGIPKDRQSKMFQRFYRARTPGTEHISGTGLGLSLVKTVIERHGGEIWFASEEGKGSTFGFNLPLRQEVPETEEEADASADSE